MQYLTAKVVCVSIHAPHEGERHDRVNYGSNNFGVSIHAPHEGERPATSFMISLSRLSFNPRSPRGGATNACGYDCGKADGFNPRSPRGGATMLADGRLTGTGGVSIHAPHEGERHFFTEDKTMTRTVSIHAPHEGERQAAVRIIALPLSVSIHAPHEGERLGKEMALAQNGTFQSTLPTRGSDLPPMARMML